MLRVLALIRASQDRRSSAVSLFRRAVVAGQIQDGTDTTGVSCGDQDPVSLCNLARLLLAPRRRRRRRLLPSLLPSLPSPDPKAPVDGFAGFGGGGDYDGRGPETDTDGPEIPPLDEEFQMPSPEDRDEAGRLFVRALVSAEAKERFSTNKVVRKVSRDSYDCGVGGEDGGGGDAGACGPGKCNGTTIDGILAQVYVEMSEFCYLFGGTKGEADGLERREGQGEQGGADAWHLSQASRAKPDTKAGLTAR